MKLSEGMRHIANVYHDTVVSKKYEIGTTKDLHVRHTPSSQRLKRNVVCGLATKMLLARLSQFVRSFDLMPNA